MTKALLIWWLFFCLQVFAAAIGYHYGVFHMIFAIDLTYISSLILAVHIITTITIGYYTYRRDTSAVDPLWFVSDTQLGLGMVGTLIGFIMMFREAFSGSVSPENLKNIVDAIATGLGTANWTTLLGLVSGLILKALLVNLEHENNES